MAFYALNNFNIGDMTEKTLSATLKDAKSELVTETTNFQEILKLFGDRGTAFLLFLIALPAALPVPAIGICVIIAPPLLFLTFQQMLGKKVIWLPNKVKLKEFSTTSLTSVIDKAIPITEKIEVLMKPRLGFLTTYQSTIIIGFLGFIMSLSVLLPIPLTNTVPSMGIAIMAMGVLMRDGLAVIAGAIIGLTWVLLLVITTIYFGTESVDIIKNFIKNFV